MHLSERHTGAPAGLVDGRGLTAAGGVLLILALGLFAVGIDVATGTGLRTAFAVLFVLACTLVAVAVHHEDLLAVLVMPPLLFLLLATAASVLDGGGPAGAWVVRRTLDVVTAMVTAAPVLFVAEAAVLGVVLVRFAVYRASVRRRRSTARPPARRPAHSA